MPKDKDIKRTEIKTNYDNPPTPPNLANPPQSAKSAKSAATPQNL